MQARNGKGGVSDFFAVAETMGITDFQVLNLMEGGEQVAVTVVIESDVPGGGHYRDEEIHLWTFDANGKVKGLRHYGDTAKHIAAWECDRRCGGSWRMSSRRSMGQTRALATATPGTSARVRKTLPPLSGSSVLSAVAM